jgi:hypothetical protein
MNIRSPATPGIDPQRFLVPEDAALPLTGRADLGGVALERARTDAGMATDLDGESLLAMDVWDSPSRSLAAQLPPSVTTPGAADLGAAVERSVDYVMSALG